MLGRLHLGSFLILLSWGLSATRAADPNCTHVADFDGCHGDGLNFCPRGIACGCKDQKPFCKCPSYRSAWQDYWYMGPRCDHLWSTLDLILIATVPAVTLAFVVIVIVQCINCKSKPGKPARQRSPSGKGPRRQAEDNRAYVPDAARPASQPQRGKADGGAAQNYKFPRLPVKTQVYEEPEPPRLGALSYIPQHPLRRAEPMDNVFLSSSPRDSRLAYWDERIPAADYEENPLPMQPLPTPAPSLFPRPQYGDPAIRYPELNQPANVARTPSRIGRPQIIYT